MGFPRQEYQSSLPFPTPGGFPHPGTDPASPLSSALVGRFLPLCYLGSPYFSKAPVYNNLQVKCRYLTQVHDPSQVDLSPKLSPTYPPRLLVQGRPMVWALHQKQHPANKQKDLSFPRTLPISVSAYPAMGNGTKGTFPIPLSHLPYIFLVLRKKEEKPGMIGGKSHLVKSLLSWFHGQIINWVQLKRMLIQKVKDLIVVFSCETLASNSEQ